MATHRLDDRLVSTFSDDAEIADLVREFVAELPVRMEAVASAARDGAWEDLRRLAHQLKGAAPAYGFEPIGAAASRVETLATPVVGLDELTGAVQDLLSVCRRASGRVGD